MAEWPACQPDWRLACVARLDPAQKGHDLLIRILALDRWRKRNLKVGFYGQGRCENGVRRLVARYNLQNIEFCGYVDDVRQIWRLNHGLVLPSRGEGLPLALVEAFLCSRMAVVTDVAGNAEMAEDGVSGFVANAPTLGSFDETLERAWHRRSDWQQMGREARKRVKLLVPSDPVKDFCCSLVKLAKTKC